MGWGRGRIVEAWGDKGKQAANRESMTPRHRGDGVDRAGHL